MACAVQMFGTWAIEPKWFAQAMNALQAGHLKPSATAEEPASSEFDEDDDEGPKKPEQPQYQLLDGGIAVIRIEGQMQKGESSFGGCSTVATRRKLRAARADWMVRGVMLHISSPGGTCAGTAELGDEIDATDQVKPVHAYIEDMGASAAYWAASQARRVSCNRAAIVGSIGTYTMLVDDTKAQDAYGVRWQVVSSGPFKGLGADGRVTDALVSDVQREINELNALFLAAVAAGRGAKIPDVAKVADGRCHVGVQAQGLGLVDDVVSMDDAIEALREEVGAMPITASQFSEYAAANPSAPEVQALVKQGADKARSELAEKPATVTELEAAFPGEDGFILAQLKAGATMSAANAAAVKDLRTKLAGKTQQAEEASKKAAAAASGTAPIPDDKSTTPTGEVSEQRKEELLNQTALGRTALGARKK